MLIIYNSTEISQKLEGLDVPTNGRELGHIFVLFTFRLTCLYLLKYYFKKNFWETKFYKSIYKNTNSNSHSCVFVTLNRQSSAFWKNTLPHESLRCYATYIPCNDVGGHVNCNGLNYDNWKDTVRWFFESQLCCVTKSQSLGARGWLLYAYNLLSTYSQGEDLKQPQHHLSFEEYVAT